MRQQKSDMVNYLLELTDDVTLSTGQKITDKVMEMVGPKEAIRRKLKLNIDLSESDKVWLQNNL